MNINNSFCYAEVYLDIKTFDIDHSFDYRIPSHLIKDIRLGSVVLVPFKTRLEIGYVSKIKRRSKLQEKEIKEIDSIIVDKPIFDKSRLKLIHWISFYYIQPIGRVFKLFLPPGGAHPKTKLKYEDCIILDMARLKEIKDKINWDKNYSQKKIIDYLIGRSKEVSRKKLLSDIRVSPLSLRALINKKIVILEKRRSRRDFKYDSFKENIIKGKDINLNYYQRKCLKAINKAIGSNIFRGFLLEGVAASGKTEVYIKACKKILKNNKKALILTPEISLTPQLFSRFEARFGSDVCVYHSGMSEAERYERWLDIREDRYKIIIGTRSALFTPINNLGIIIIDEEHDSSYKESSTIRYNTADVALRLGKILRISVILGSATPSIVSKFRAENDEKFTLLKIPVTAFGEENGNLLEKQVIDLKRIDRFKDDFIITSKLFSEINNELNNNNKVILFINRRGYSNFILCRDCGEIPKCSRCNLSYNFHKDGAKLLCHHCGREQKFTGKCFSCGSSSIFLGGTGIQKVESKLKIRFKKIPILRMDSDSTVKKKSHELILRKFNIHGPSILIGTQMIAKGLDIEDLTLVGIINCDGMMALPDFHMFERVYQLITQVSGRAGRRSKQGKILIQTYNPDSSVIKNFIEGNYDIFYRSELANRRELMYPPFSNIINIIISGRDEKSVASEAEKLFMEISKIVNSENDILLGPAPSPFYKIKSFYRWHILIKTKEIRRLNMKLSKILKKFEKFIKNKIILDVDPAWIL